MNKQILFPLLLLLFLLPISTTAQSEKVLTLLDSATYYQSHDYDKVRQFSQEAIELSQENSDEVGLSLAYKSLISYYIIIGNSDSIENVLKKAEPLFESLKDSVNLIHCQIFKAKIFENKYEYDEAIECYKKLLENPFVLSKDDLYSLILIHLATVYGTIDHYESAYTLFQEALIIFQKMHDSIQLVRTYNNLIVLDYLNDFKDGYEASINHFEAAYPIAQAIDNQYLQALLMTNISDVYISIGDMAQAKSYLYQVVDMFEAIQEWEQLSTTYRRLSLIASEEEGTDEAIQWLYKSLQIPPEHNSQDNICYDFYAIGAIFQQKGDHKNAIDYFEQSIQIARNINNHGQLLDALKLEIFSYAALEQFDAAENCFAEYLTCYKSLRLSDEIENLYLNKETQKRQREKVKSDKLHHQTMIIQTILIISGLILFCWLFTSKRRKTPTKKR